MGSFAGRSAFSEDARQPNYSLGRVTPPGQIVAQFVAEARLQWHRQFFSPLSTFSNAQKFCPAGFAALEESLLLALERLVVNRARDLLVAAPEPEMAQDAHRLFLRSGEQIFVAHDRHPGRLIRSPMIAPGYADPVVHSCRAVEHGLGHALEAIIFSRQQWIKSVPIKFFPAP